MVKSWAESIRDDLLWARIHLRRHEVRAQVTIDRHFKAARSQIEALLQQDQRMNAVRDARLRATIFVYNRMRPLMREMAQVAKATIGFRMYRAAEDTRRTTRAAFFMEPHPHLLREQEGDIPHESLEGILPWEEMPAAMYEEVLTADLLGTTLEAWAGKFPEAFLPAMAQEYALGIAAGESVALITHRMKKAFDLPNYRAKAMARTAVMAASNDMQSRIYKANEHLLTGYKFTATLSIRTCEECGGYDGNVYAVDESRPALPIHLQCRCNYAPVMKSAKELFGEDIQIAPHLRAAMDGAEPSTVTWEDWIKREENQKKLEAFQKAMRQKAYKKAKAKKKAKEKAAKK